VKDPAMNPTVCCYMLVYGKKKEA